MLSLCFLNRKQPHNYSIESQTKQSLEVESYRTDSKKKRRFNSPLRPMAVYFDKKKTLNLN